LHIKLNFTSKSEKRNLWPISSFLVRTPQSSLPWSELWKKITYNVKNKLKIHLYIYIYFLLKRNRLHFYLVVWSLQNCQRFWSVYVYRRVAVRSPWRDSIENGRYLSLACPPVTYRSNATSAVLVISLIISAFYLLIESLLRHHI